MPVENYIDLLPVILLGVVFFGSAVGMLYCSVRRGQLRDFDEQAKVIITHEEPEGEISDLYPHK